MHGLCTLDRRDFGAIQEVLLEEILDQSAPDTMVSPAMALNHGVDALAAAPPEAAAVSDRDRLGSLAPGPVVSEHAANAAAIIVTVRSWFVMMFLRLRFVGCRRAGWRRDEPRWQVKPEPLCS